jgi:hypothetical protein
MVPSSWVKILRLIAEGHPVEAHEDQFIVVQNPDFQPDMNDPNFVIDTHALAASPSVGGWENDPYLATDLALVNDLIYQHGGDAALAGWVRLCRRITAAPPPPSVSIGSRPQEAVPTAQTVPAVVGWQDIETAPRDGRWLLLEGEMSGGDTSTVRVGRWNPTYSDATRCTYEWQCVDPYAHGTEDEAVGPDGFWNWYSDGRISGWQPLPAAEGCSSNEGVGQ